MKKAVIMAGGKASRLLPLTEAVNKPMLPVYNRPMIEHVIVTLVEAGITDILVLLGHLSAESVMVQLEDGARFGCSILYCYLRDPGSIPRHLGIARAFVGSDDFVLMLSDSLFLTPLSFEGKKSPHMWAMPLDADFDDFRKYAEVELSEDHTKVISLTGKVVEPVTGIIQTGVWVFGPDVFGVAEGLLRNPTLSREIQVRDIAQYYVQKGEMNATLLPPRSFLDLGTIDALFLANVLVHERVHLTLKPNG